MYVPINVFIESFASLCCILKHMGLTIIILKLFSTVASQIDNAHACENRWRDNSANVVNGICNCGLTAEHLALGTIIVLNEPKNCFDHLFTFNRTNLLSFKFKMWNPNLNSLLGLERKFGLENSCTVVLSELKASEHWRVSKVKNSTNGFDRLSKYSGFTSWDDYDY